MQRIVIAHLGGLTEVPDDRAQRRWGQTHRHLDRICRCMGMDPATNAASARGDEDGVPRITTHQDDLITTKQRRLGVGVEIAATIEVSSHMNRQRSGYPGDRVHIEILDVAVGRQQPLDLGFTIGVGDTHFWLGDHHRVRIGDATPEGGHASRVELDRKVLETHVNVLLVLTVPCPTPLRHRGRCRSNVATSHRSDARGWLLHPVPSALWPSRWARIPACPNAPPC